MEKERVCLAEIERQCRKREAKLMRLVKEEDKRSKRGVTKARKRSTFSVSRI